MEPMLANPRGVHFAHGWDLGCSEPGPSHLKALASSLCSADKAFKSCI